MEAAHHLELPDGTRCDLLSLPDLVQAKKTQRDKDWPMIRRLVEAHYFQNQAKPSPARIRFWLEEFRTPQLLVDTATLHPAMCRRLSSGRPLLKAAVAKDLVGLKRGLLDEENAERGEDQRYWLPLKNELEALRHSKT